MKTLALGIAAAATLIAAPASAESIHVQYADLDLSTVQGQRTLDARIHSAARKVCNVTAAHAGGPLKAGEAMRCVDRAEASAMQAFASAARADGRTG